MHKLFHFPKLASVSDSSLFLKFCLALKLDTQLNNINDFREEGQYRTSSFGMSSDSLRLNGETFTLSFGYGKDNIFSVVKFSGAYIIQLHLSNYFVIVTADPALFERAKKILSGYSFENQDIKEVSYYLQFSRNSPLSLISHVIYEVLENNENDSYELEVINSVSNPIHSRDRSKSEQFKLTTKSGEYIVNFRTECMDTGHGGDQCKDYYDFKSDDFALEVDVAHNSLSLNAENPAVLQELINTTKIFYEKHEIIQTPLYEEVSSELLLDVIMRFEYETERTRIRNNETDESLKPRFNNELKEEFTYDAENLTSIDEKEASEYFKVLTSKIVEFRQAFDFSFEDMVCSEIEGEDADGEKIVMWKGEYTTVVFKLKTKFPPSAEKKSAELNIVIDNKASDKLPSRVHWCLSNSLDADNFKVNQLESFYQDRDESEFATIKNFKFWIMLSF